MSDCPVRTCKSCGFKTVSTSTIDWCPKCKDEDGLRPRHFLTRDKETDSESVSTATNRESKER